jgi:uncharacterized membrane protein YhaH (DUF805 family)
LQTYGKLNWYNIKASYYQLIFYNMNYYIEVFKKWNDFKGRSRRAECWYFVLFNFLFYIILYIVLLPVVASTQIFSQIFISVTYLYLFLAFIPWLAVVVRRLHDTGRSGWWLSISMIPLVGPVWFLVLVVKDSNPGDNKYGPNPKILTSPVQPTAT